VTKKAQTNAAQAAPAVNTAKEQQPAPRFIDLPGTPQDKPPAAPGDGALRIGAAPGETAEEVAARIALHPAIQNAFIAKVFAEGKVPEQGNKITGPLDMNACAESMVQKIETLDGKTPMRVGEQMLLAQAEALQAVFYEMMRRAALNMGQYIEPTEIYMRLGLKAQSQCRATIETLGELKNPRPIYLNPKQVNNVAGNQQVNSSEGPQQVNNGTPASADAASPANALALENKAPGETLKAILATRETVKAA
jgi:hypothetical protein